MNCWPLLFTFQHKVYGEGFLAKIVMHGKLLATQEEQGVWMDGVQPADLSAGGKDLYDAYLKFRKAFNEILEDIAEEKTSFWEFKEDIQSFFNRTDVEALVSWDKAVEKVRTEKADLENIPKKEAESPRYVEVTLIEDFRAHQAVLGEDTIYEVAA